MTLIPVLFLLLCHFLIIQESLTKETSVFDNQVSNLINHLVLHDASFTNISGLALVSDNDFVFDSEMLAQLNIPAMAMVKGPLEKLPELISHVVFYFDSPSSAHLAMSSLNPQEFNHDSFYLMLTSFAPPVFDLSYSASKVMFKHLCFGVINNSSNTQFRFLAPKRIRNGELVSTTVWLSNSQSELIRPSIFSGQSKDLEGEEMIVTTFHYPPMVYKHILSEGSAKFDGYEVRLIKTLADSLNFKPVFRDTSDGLKWGGFMLRNNVTMNGLKGDLQLGKTDIGMGNVYMRYHDKTYFDYTYPYVYDAYCFLTKKSKSRQYWLSLMQPMTTTTWLCSILAICLSILVLRAYIKIYGSGTIGLPEEQALLFIIGCIFGEHRHFIPKKNAVRLFLGPVMVGLTILILGYSSTLKSFLVVTILPKSYDTIEDLASLNIKVGNLIYSLKVLHEFIESPNPVQKKFADVYEPFPSYEWAFEHVSQGELSMMESKTYMDFMIRKNFTDRFGHTDLHIMEECWHSIELVALGLQKHSAFEPLLSYQLKMLEEAGLIQKFIQDELNIVGRASKETQVEINAVIPLSPMHLRTPVLVLGVCLTMAVVALLIEIVKSLSDMTVFIFVSLC